MHSLSLMLFPRRVGLANSGVDAAMGMPRRDGNFRAKQLVVVYQVVSDLIDYRKRSGRY